jgi:DNA-binding transcriptional LysR family regulator
MPDHLVAGLIAEERLVPLEIEHDPNVGEALTIYAAHRRAQVLGPAGRWLLDTLRQRLAPP